MGHEKYVIETLDREANDREVDKIQQQMERRIRCLELTRTQKDVLLTMRDSPFTTSWEGLEEMLGRTIWEGTRIALVSKKLVHEQLRKDHRTSVTLTGEGLLVACYL